MREQERIQALEARLGDLEAQTDELRGTLGRMTDKAHLDHGRQLLELSELGSKLGRQLAIQSDRIASMIIKHDVTHSNIEHLDSIQEGIHETLRDQANLLEKIFKQLPQQQPGS